MSNPTIALSMVRELIADKSLSEEDTITAVNTIISPLLPKTVKTTKSATKSSKIIMAAIDKIAHKNGYCANCHLNKLSKKSDSACASCKKKLRDACKKELQKNFFSL